MAKKTLVEKAAETVGFGLAMAEDVAGTVKTAIGSMAEALKKSPAKKATKKAAKKAATKKAAKKAPAKKAAKKAVAKKTGAKKAEKKSVKKPAQKAGRSRR
jgi:hypothetical protein